MMGVRKAEAQLFYEFNLESHVPADHLLREIDRFLDMDGMREKLRPFYSHTGRPSIDPELIVRMLVVGYVMGSAPSVGCAKTSISTWPTDGSAASASMTRCPTIRPSRGIGTASSGRAVSCGRCSSRPSSAA
jgi:hypothetical protein